MTDEKCATPADPEEAEEEEAETEVEESAKVVSALITSRDITEVATDLRSKLAPFAGSLSSFDKISSMKETIRAASMPAAIRGASMEEAIRDIGKSSILEATRGIGTSAMLEATQGIGLFNIGDRGGERIGERLARSSILPWGSSLEEFSARKAGLARMDLGRLLDQTPPWSRYEEMTAKLDRLSLTNVGRRFDEFAGSITKASLCRSPFDEVRKAMLPLAMLEPLEPGRRFGLLAPVESDSPLAGIITAVSPKRRMPSVTPLVDPETTEGSEQSSDRILVADVTCPICGGPLFPSKQGELRVDGRKLHLKMHVFPLCATCFNESEGSREWWLEKLREFTRRDALRLVSDTGKSDGVARGRGLLRLVKDDEEPSDE